MVVYCFTIMYSYYSRLGFFTMKKIGSERYSPGSIQQHNKFHKKIFMSILFVMVLLCKMLMQSLEKIEVITPITNYMVPVDYCRNKKYVTTFTLDYMISKFEVFSNHKLDVFLYN